MSVSAGNVIVRNGQLNVSAGIYGDSDTFYIDSENDRVGIGTTSPSAKLDVEGNIDLSDYNLTDVAVISGGGDAVSFVDNIDLGFNDLLLSDPTYNSSISLGGTSSGTNKPALAINVQPADPVNENAAVRVFRTGDVKDYGEFVVVEPNVGTVRFRLRSYKAGQGTNYLGLENATNLYVDGNVGIGTTSPDEILDVVKTGNMTVKIRSSTAANGTQARLGFATTEAAGLFSAGIAAEREYGGAYSGLIFYTQPNAVGGDWSTLSERVRITKEGYVGVGTSAPTTKLEVVGGSTPVLTLNRTSDNGVSIHFLNNQGGFYMGMDLDENFGMGPNLDVGSSPWIYVINSSGYVGIGTTEPLKLLHVEGSDAGIAVKNTGTASAYVRFQTSEDVKGYVGYDDDGTMKLVTGTGLSDSVQGISIDNTGKVGIGTTSPGSRLTVSGDVALVNAVDVFKSSGNSVSMGENIGVKTLAKSIYIKNSGDTAILAMLGYDGTGYFSSNVGIGTTDPGSYTLYVNGDLYASGGYKPGGGSWSDSSDIRLKKNVSNITSALEKISLLRGVSFEWINPGEHGDLTGLHAGFIAQEMEQVFPAWVGGMNATGRDQNLTNGTVKTLELPYGFNAYLVEAIKELKEEKDAEIGELQRDNEALKELVCTDHPDAAFCRGG